MDSNEEWTMEFLCTVDSTIAHCVLRVAFVPFHPVSPQEESPFNITVKATLTPNPSHECSRTSPKQLTTGLPYFITVYSVSALSRVYRLYDARKKLLLSSNYRRN